MNNKSISRNEPLDPRIRLSGLGQFGHRNGPENGREFTNCGRRQPRRSRFVTAEDEDRIEPSEGKRARDSVSDWRFPGSFGDQTHVAILVC